MLTISVFYASKNTAVMQKFMLNKINYSLSICEKTTTSCHMTHIMALAPILIIQVIIKRHIHQAWFCYVVDYNNIPIEPISGCWKSF